MDCKDYVNSTPFSGSAGGNAHVTITNSGPTTFDFKKHNEVDYPAHYLSLGTKCSSCHAPIEHIDISRHFDFNLGNAIKYIWRSKFKGKQIEDLKKAIWYINDFINNHKPE